MNKKNGIEFDLGYTLNKYYADKEELMELVYQSNLIEGISDYWIGTVCEGEEFKLAPTLTGHFDAMDYVQQNYKSYITHEEVRRVHLTLMKDLMKKAGEYRKEGNSFIVSRGKFVAGNPLPEFIPQLMDSWLEKAVKVYRLEDAINLHYEYEIIHPFSDGNGRSGRMLLNWLGLQKLDKYIIIENKNKQQYYSNIQEYRKRFMKDNAEIKFTTYDMLSKDAKKHFKEVEKEHESLLMRILTCGSDKKRL